MKIQLVRNDSVLPRASIQINFFYSVVSDVSIFQTSIPLITALLLCVVASTIKLSYWILFYKYQVTLLRPYRINCHLNYAYELSLRTVSSCIRVMSSQNYQLRHRRVSIATIFKLLVLAYLSSLNISARQMTQ